jgi:hypothetical protein
MWAALVSGTGFFLTVALLFFTLPTLAVLVCIAAALIGFSDSVRLPLKIETTLLRERGYRVTDGFRASLRWKPGRRRKGFEFALYFTRKSLPPMDVVDKVPLTGRQDS